MKITVIGSSSKGNSYALESNGQLLLIEAGVRPQKVREKIGFRLSTAVGCLVSHGHL